VATSETLEPGKPLTVRQVMARGWVRCTPETPLSTVASIMRECGVDRVVIAEGDHGEPGLVTTETILAEVAAGAVAGDRPAGEVAIRPLPCVAAEDTVEHARRRLTALGVERLGVTGADGELDRKSVV